MTLLYFGVKNGLIMINMNVLLDDINMINGCKYLKYLAQVRGVGVYCVPQLSGKVKDDT